MAVQGKVIKQYEVELWVEGVLVGSADDYTLPKVEIETAEHSEGTYNKSTPGKIKTGDLVLKRLLRFGESTPLWLWLFSAQNYNGTGGIPELYERNGQLIIGGESYDLEEFWVQAIDLGSANPKSSDNMIAEITFKVTRFKPSNL